jgi:hypothetical protein
MRALLPVALLVPAMLAAQSPQWSRPYVADARFWLQKAGERRGQPLIAGQTVELEAGQEATLTVEPQDQWGRPFPPELSGFFVDDPRSCQGLVTVESSSPTTFRLKAGTERGRCQLRLVAAGNLNLEWTFTLKVASVAHGGYTRGQAEYIATRLYRALLGREPDPEGFRAAVAEIQRNRLGSLLEGMLKSPEFKEKWRGKPPTQFLEQIYQGLLGRPPDSEGVRRYLREVERGHLKGVLADIIHSEEFEEAMLRAEGRTP